MTMCTLVWLGRAATAHAAEDIRLYTDDYRIDAIPLVTDFSHPWSLEFLPDGMILVTEKEGALFRVDPATGEPGVMYAPTDRDDEGRYLVNKLTVN